MYSKAPWLTPRGLVINHWSVAICHGFKTSDINQH